MRSSKTTIRWPFATSVMIAAGAGLLTWAASASAASLGGAGVGDLLAFSEPQSVPLPLAFDHFDGCSGELDASLDVVDNSWTSPSTNWRCRPARSRAHNRDLGTVGDSVTVDVGKSDHVVVSTSLERTSRTAGGAGSGLSLFHDGSSHHMYVVYQRGADQIVVGRIDDAGDTELRSWSWLPRTNSIELVVEIDQPDVRVYADGSLLGTHTLSISEVASLGANTRFGLESDSDRRSRWAWFKAEDITP